MHNNSLQPTAIPLCGLAAAELRRQMSNEPSGDLIYKTAGEALHVDQVLEINVRSLISILNKHASAGIDANAIILSEDRRTLGRLIEKLRPLAQFCSDTEAALSAALAARNYVAHEFFIRHNDAFSSDEAMQEARETSGSGSLTTDNGDK